MSLKNKNIIEAVRINQDKDIENWIQQKGLELFQFFGMKKNQTVIDFGCGSGIYSLTAGKVVGDKGIVYAVDEEQKNLEKILDKTKNLDLNNVTTVNKNDFQKLKEKNNFADFVLLFDVLHYFDKKNREELYKNFHQMLTKNGKIVIYPKHTKDNWPMWNLSDVSDRDLQREIEKHGFYFKETVEDILVHDNQFEKDNIYIFEKR